MRWKQRNYERTTIRPRLHMMGKWLKATIACDESSFFFFTSFRQLYEPRSISRAHMVDRWWTPTHAHVFPVNPRSQWHGVSSQGMLSVGPLGDACEAVRLEALAGRGSSGRGGGGGGGSSGCANSVHAIRCFNAQVTVDVVLWC